MCGFWFMCYVCALLSLEFMALFTVFNLWLVQVLNLPINFKFFKNLFLVTTLGQDLFLGAYFENQCLNLFSELTQLFQHLYSSSTTRFSRFCPKSGRFYNNMHGKSYRGGGLQFTVNTPKYTSFDYHELNNNQNLCNYCM